MFVRIGQLNAPFFPRCRYEWLANPLPALVYSGRAGAKISIITAPSGPPIMPCSELPGATQKSPLATAISSPS